MPDHHRSAPPGPKQTPPMIKPKPKAQPVEPAQAAPATKPKVLAKAKTSKRK